MPRGRVAVTRAPLLAVIGVFAVAALSLAPPASGSTVLVTRVDDTITPVIADHLADGVRVAERDGHQAYIVELDTPGGLLESTRDIVGDFLGAHVPVVVYVAPSGARAASAGAYIVLSSNVAAMAPGTHIGAGTPVTGSGDTASSKVVNDAAAFAVAIAIAIAIAEQPGRNTAFAEDMVREGTAITDRQALDNGVVDLTAATRGELLAGLDGREVTVAPDRQVTLQTARAKEVGHDLGFFDDVRQTLANPELAFLFLFIGTLAVVYELAAPAVGLAGVAGVVLLVLGLTALSVLPFDVAGLLLLLLAAASFAAEVFTAGFGVFAVGGTAALVFGGLLLFDGDVGVDPAVLWPTAVVTGAGALLAGRLAWRARKARPTTGQEALVGHDAVVHHADGPTGQAWVDIGAKGPGLFLIIPFVDRMVRVSLRTVTMDIPPQDVITKDNVTVRVNAVTYFNVVDPNRSVVAVENHIQTTLRSILGQVDLDELLVNRDEINQRPQQIIDQVTDPWGIKVTLVEVKDVELPETMRRAMPGRPNPNATDAPRSSTRAESSKPPKRSEPPRSPSRNTPQPSTCASCRPRPKSPGNETPPSSSPSPWKSCPSSTCCANPPPPRPPIRHNHPSKPPQPPRPDPRNPCRRPLTARPRRRPSAQGR
ncbi:SPFH domain-containing protein [Embleya sp. NPDC050154]|uniref:SPFH domain-containing protein n=1 Tax=Embleya sp. NPDC050154 TaxID=3363988 RepID=UPI003788A06D